MTLRSLGLKCTYTYYVLFFGVLALLDLSLEFRERIGGRVLIAKRWAVGWAKWSDERKYFWLGPGIQSISKYRAKKNKKMPKPLGFEYGYIGKYRYMYLVLKFYNIKLIPKLNFWGSEKKSPVLLAHNILSLDQVLIFWQHIFEPDRTHERIVKIGKVTSNWNRYF